jgi:hypothetical protein
MLNPGQKCNNSGIVTGNDTAIIAQAYKKVNTQDSEVPLNISSPS